MGTDTEQSLDQISMKFLKLALLVLMVVQYASPKHYLVETEDDEMTEKEGGETLYTRRYGEDYGDDYAPICFPGSSQVKLTTGESRSMADLTIHTEDGNKVSLSGTHIMFVNDYEDILAENVVIGDTVIVEDGNNVTKSRVVNIEAEVKEGAYVPLTEHGTLLVDGVLCSSFANIPHDILQFIAAPVRWFPSLFLSEEEGERSFVTASKHLGYYIHKLGLLKYYHSSARQKDVQTECGSLEKKTKDMEGPPTVSSMNVDTSQSKVRQMIMIRMAIHMELVTFFALLFD